MFWEKRIAGSIRFGQGGRDVVKRYDWANLTSRECYILRGFTAKDDTEGVWGLLGDMSASRQASFVLNNKNKPDVEAPRQRISEQIQRVVPAAGDIINVAHEAVHEIWKVRCYEDQLHGIGPAAATRWLTLARPDCLVSVNKASAPGLGGVSHLPRDPNLVYVLLRSPALVARQTLVQ